MSVLNKDLLEKGCQYVLENIKNIPLDSSLLKSPIEKDLFHYSLLSGYWDGYHNEIEREFEVSTSKLVIFSLITNELSSQNISFAEEDKFYMSIVLADLCFYCANEAFEEDTVKEWVECYFLTISWIFEKYSFSSFFAMLCDYLESRSSWILNGYDIKGQPGSTKAEPHKKPYQMLSKVFINYLTISNELSSEHTLFESKVNNRFSAFINNLFNLDSFALTEYKKAFSVDYPNLIKLNSSRSFTDTTVMGKSSKFDKYLKLMCTLQEPFKIIQNLKTNDHKTFLNNLSATTDMLCYHEDNFTKNKVFGTERFYRDLCSLNQGIKSDAGFVYHNTHRVDLDLFKQFEGGFEYHAGATSNDVEDAEMFINLVQDQDSSFYRKKCLMKIYLDLSFLKLIFKDSSVFESYFSEKNLASTTRKEELLRTCSSPSGHDFISILESYSNRIFQSLSADKDFEELLIPIIESAIHNFTEKCKPSTAQKERISLEVAVKEEDLPVFNRSFPRIPNVRYGNKNIERVLSTKGTIALDKVTGGEFKKELSDLCKNLKPKIEESNETSIVWKSMPLLNLSGLFPPLNGKKLEMIDLQKKTIIECNIDDYVNKFMDKIHQDKESFENFKQFNKEYYDRKCEEERKLEEERKAHDAKLEEARRLADEQRLKAESEEYNQQDLRKRRYSAVTEDMYGDEAPVKRPNRFSNKRLGE